MREMNMWTFSIRRNRHKNKLVTAVADWQHDARPTTRMLSVGPGRVCSTVSCIRPTCYKQLKVIIWIYLLTALTYDQATWQNFLSSAFWTKSRSEVPLFLELPEFPYNTVKYRWKEASMPKISSIHSAILVQHQLVTDRHTHTYTDTGLRHIPQ